ncbi:hypothetical protein FE257_010925 [Aspergillus nanangensis]|uniref:Uncharacterized protein n=1 Tax=Aspergillus nanangensis TaxID=2582783 RepID=A0AAD4CXI9_ASPNN|nr:hypothetical protein FE257_010925 [Aspergillus nanangensis]
MALVLLTTVYLSLMLATGRVWAEQSHEDYTWPNQTYITSRLQPPYVNITKHGKSEPGYLFLTPTDRVIGKHARPTIIDSDGELIWQGTSNNATGLKPQIYQGKPVITYWEGERPSVGAWAGSVVVMNGTYDEIARVSVSRSEGLSNPGTPDYKWSFIDMHESTMTAQGTMLAIAPNTTQADLRPVGGDSDSSVTDCVVYEGQNGGDFTLGRGTQFCWQHDARVYQETEDLITLSLMNNDNVYYDHGAHATTGLLLDVNIRQMTETLNRRVFDADDQIYSTQEGNMQKLGNGHLLVAYGLIPKIKEFDANGACVMTAQFAAYHESNALMDSYRVLKSTWVGTPRTLPSVSACMADETIRVYVSWNGATDIQKWEIFLGMSRRDMEHVHTAIRNGFETVIEVEKVDMGAGLEHELKKLATKTKYLAVLSPPPGGYADTIRDINASNVVVLDHYSSPWDIPNLRGKCDEFYGRQNAKSLLILEALGLDPFNTSHFVWLDARVAIYEGTGFDHYDMATVGWTHPVAIGKAYDAMHDPDPIFFALTYLLRTPDTPYWPAVSSNASEIGGHTLSSWWLPAGPQIGDGSCSPRTPYSC